MFHTIPVLLYLASVPSLGSVLDPGERGVSGLTGPTSNHLPEPVESVSGKVIDDLKSRNTCRYLLELQSPPVWIRQSGLSTCFITNFSGEIGGSRTSI